MTTKGKSKHSTADAVHDAEVVMNGGPADSVTTTALAEFEKESEQTQSLAQSFADRIQMMENAIELVERRGQLFETLRMTAIKGTWPNQWVVNRDREGRQICIPSQAACLRIGQVFGVQVRNKRPVNAQGDFEPKRIEKKGDVVEYRGWCNAFSKSTGDEIYDVMAARRSNEKFIGRDGNETDLELAVSTLLTTKSIRVLSGCSQVPIETLKAAWRDDDSKNINDLQKGHGYGSSSERGADQVIDDDVKKQQAQLGQEIMRRVGGDAEAAKQLCKEITANPPKFDGFDSVRRLTQGWQFENAWKKLKAHATFGDDAQQGDGGANAEG